jgi:hypothetical protein
VTFFRRFAPALSDMCDILRPCQLFILMLLLEDLTFVPCTDCTCQLSVAGPNADNIKHLMSSHKSACKAACQSIAGTAKGKPKYTVHKTAETGGFQWLPGGTDLQPKVPYCMRQPRPPWIAPSKNAAVNAVTNMGCRRVHGSDDGCCNAEKQKNCQRSINCLCGLPKTSKWTKDAVKQLLDKICDVAGTAEANTAAVVSEDEKQILWQWWGSMCSCSVETLKYPDHKGDASRSLQTIVSDLQTIG